MKDLFYYMCGIGFLALAWLKHFIFGYTTPKHFGMNEVCLGEQR